MNNLITALVATLLPLSIVSAEYCPATSEKLIGVWEQSGENVFFQIFKLEKHIFNSWLHERPEIINAHWELENCIITIDNKSDTGFKFKVINTTQNSIKLYNLSSKVESHYVRLKD